MKNNLKTYSIDEVKEKMEKYLDISQERLRSHLREAWKKQHILKTKNHARVKI